MRVAHIVPVKPSREELVILRLHGTFELVSGS